jgi:hypothetical protein
MLFLKTEFMLGDAFEATGEWWLPENPENRAHGTLRYACANIELELTGPLESVTTETSAGVGGKFVDYPCIHGQSNEGMRYTLLTSFVSEYGTTTKYSPIYIIVGSHTADAASLNLSSVSFFCNHWDRFIACGGLFSLKKKQGSDEFKSAMIRFIQSKKASWHITNIAATLELDVESKLRCGEMSAEISARPFAVFTPDSSQKLDWFIKKIWRFCYLITLLSDERITPTGFQIDVEGEESPCWLLYGVTKEVADGHTLTAPSLLFHLGHVYGDFQAILEKWFTVTDMLLNAIHLTMDAHRNLDQTGQGRFLLLAHAAEVISRATMSSEYMSRRDYATVKRVVMDAIPSEVHKDHRMSLKSKIKYGNEYAFHKRVRLLIESLTKPAQEIVCRDPKAFARGVADTRNYYTHFTDELSPKALPPIAMYWATEKLLFLVRIVLFKYLGIPEEVIVKRMKHHHRLHQRMLLSKEHPECMRKK